MSTNPLSATIQANPPLTREQELEIFDVLRQHGPFLHENPGRPSTIKELHRKLILSNLRACYKIAQLYIQWAERGTTIHDLADIGVMGIINAIKHYDPEITGKTGKKLKFSWYAYKWIRCFISREIRKQTAKYGTRMYSLVPHIMKFIAQFHSINNRKPTHDEVINKFGLSREDYQQCCLSLLQNIPLSCIDNAEQIFGETQDETVHCNEVKTIVRNEIERLPVREKLVMTMIMDNPGKTPLRLMAKELGGITRERVRQIKRSAYSRLSQRLDLLNINQ